MLVLGEFVHRCLSPFMAGATLAATTVVGDMPSAGLLVAVAAAFAFMSLPAGGRIIRRAVGNDSEV